MSSPQPRTKNEEPGTAAPADLAGPRSTLKVGLLSAVQRFEKQSGEKVREIHLANELHVRGRRYPTVIRSLRLVFAHGETVDVL